MTDSRTDEERLAADYEAALFAFYCDPYGAAIRDASGGLIATVEARLLFHAPLHARRVAEAVVLLLREAAERVAWDADQDVDPPLMELVAAAVGIEWEALVRLAKYEDVQKSLAMARRTRIFGTGDE